jgi:drug/metabolite transporter (DMT)-like permease
MIGPGVPAHLHKRIALFYLLGVLNAFLGLYVLIQEVPSVSGSRALWLAAFFLAFAAINFWFPYAMVKKWRADQAKLRAGAASETGDDGKSREPLDRLSP